MKEWDKAMLVGSPEHQAFEARECLKMALKDEINRLQDELDKLEEEDRNENG